MMTVSVIIPTYERPDELRRCLATLLRQTALPTELIVVDDGGLGQIPLGEELARAGVRCRYVKKDRPGLTESRNAGIEISTGDVIVFLDDDVTLEPGFIEGLARAYARDPEQRIGGVGGVIEPERPLTASRRVRYLFDRIFLLSGPVEGRVLRSGAFVSFGTTPYPIDGEREVHFLPGCAQSYRREVFETMRFTEGYRDHAFGEDKDFSCGVAQRWRLVVTPAARCRHHHAAPMRPDHWTFGRKRIVGRYLFYRRHVRKNAITRLLFWYSLSGYFVARTTIALISFRRSEYRRLAGMFAGLAAIAAGRLPAEPPAAGSPAHSGAVRPSCASPPAERGATRRGATRPGRASSR